MRRIEEEQERQRTQEKRARKWDEEICWPKERKENGEVETKIEKRETERERWQTRRHARPSVSRRLAICVVFYDNYKYGRKALCLEQLVRLFETLPLLATVQRRLFRLQKVDDLLYTQTRRSFSYYVDHSFFGRSRWGRGESDTRVDRSIKNLRLSARLSVTLGGNIGTRRNIFEKSTRRTIGYLHVKISAVRLKKGKKATTRRWHLLTICWGDRDQDSRLSR